MNKEELILIMTCSLPWQHGKANWDKHFFQIGFGRSVSTTEQSSIDCSSFFSSTALSATLSCSLTLYLGNRTSPKYCPRSKSTESSAGGNTSNEIDSLYCHDYPLNDPLPPFFVWFAPKTKIFLVYVVLGF